MSRPTDDIPVWAESGLTSEPSTGKKATGWVVEKPPYQEFNWMQREYGRWITYFDDTITGYETLVATDEVQTDIVNETSGSGNGVTIDGVLLKDSEVNTDTINEADGSGNGVTVDGVTNKGGFLGVGTSSPDYPVEVVETAGGALARQLVLANSSNDSGTAAEMVFASTSSIVSESNGLLKLRSIRQADGSCDLSVVISPGGASAPIEAVSFPGSTGGIKTDNVALKTKVIDIGDWNMDASATKSVTHGLTQTKIRAVSAMIRSDSDTSYLPLNCTSSTDVIAGGVDTGGISGIILRRTAGGRFDNTSYDTASSYNRGWITITYEA